MSLLFIQYIYIYIWFYVIVYIDLYRWHSCLDPHWTKSRVNEMRRSMKFSLTCRSVLQMIAMLPGGKDWPSHLVKWVAHHFWWSFTNFTIHQMVDAFPCVSLTLLDLPICHMESFCFLMELPDLGCSHFTAEEIQLFPPGRQWQCHSAPPFQKRYSDTVIPWQQLNHVKNVKNVHLCISWLRMWIGWPAWTSRPKTCWICWSSSWVGSLGDWPDSELPQIDDIRTVHMLDHVHLHYMDIMDRYMIYHDISWYIMIYHDISWESWNRWRTWMRPSISSMAVSLDAPRTRSHWAMSVVGNCWEIDARWCCMMSDEARWRLWICYVVTWVYFSICWLKCPTISNVLLESLWKCWCLHRSTANGRMRLTLREFERGLSSMGCKGPQREWSKTPSVMKIVCAEF